MATMNTNSARSDLASCGTRRVRAKLLRRIHRLWCTVLHKHILPRSVAFFNPPSLWGCTNIMGMLAIHFISLYTAGLNASAPDKVHVNFLAFIAAFGWGAIVSLVFNWKGEPAKETTQRKTADYFLAGIRMGVGTSVALLVSNLFGFDKLGWAPSGAGLVIGYDTETS